MHLLKQLLYFLQKQMHPLFLREPSSPRSIDCTGWPEHVGIVVGTYGPYIRVVEGNMDDGFAGYRTILRNDWCIRGYGLPDYASK